MKGLMQDWQLTVPKILDHAALHHGDGEVVTRTIEGPIVRITYAALRRRVKKLANALRKLGVEPGDRIATMAWNTQRHMESWYALAGLGAVCHTVNPRLFPDQIVYIINHAEDKILMLDLSFVPLLEQIAEKLPSIKTIIIFTDRAHMPKTQLTNVLCYEDLIAPESEDFEWVPVREDDACGLCYTSGTTGNPKGVLYSHRSNVLLAMMATNADVMGLRCVDSILPVVPMYHANAWGIVFSGPMQGAKLVLPGAKLDGESLCELFTTEEVTFTAGVPTVWLGLVAHLEQKGTSLPHLKRLMTGGSAVAPSLIETLERDHGIEVYHCWGMTELSPIGTYGGMKRAMLTMCETERFAFKAKQGRAPFGVEMTIMDDEDRIQPCDGKTFGRLMVRGAAVVGRYFKEEGRDILDGGGWFDTGDIATIDEHGFMQITDRAKDVIKSGGEWISSIEIENLALGHPAVAEAAVIGVPHPKWDERPLLIVVKKPGAALERADLLRFLEGKIVKWWMPDDVAFIEELPHTATGKIQKTALRALFKDYVLPVQRQAG